MVVEDPKVPGSKLTEREFNVVVERDEDGYYVGSVIELPSCHTQAKSLAELIERVKEAILVYLDETGSEYSESELVGIFKVKVAIKG